MKNIYFISFLLLSIIFINTSFAASNSIEQVSTEELTLIIGNCRAGGKVQKHLRSFVAQSSADFTHQKSFKGKVVSVDLLPKPPRISLPHKIMDFARLAPDEILARLDGQHPTCILFEWFPSYDKFTPILLRALRNAVAILAPKGKVIIDHMPYSSTLEDDDMDALKELSLSDIDLDHLKIAVIKERLKGGNQPDRSPGIISRLLQNADPFSMYMSMGELEAIRTYLFDIFNEKKPSRYSSLVNYDAVDKAISSLSRIYSIDPKKLSDKINSEILSMQDPGLREHIFYHYDIFEWFYYMESRAPFILQALRDIGFDVKDNAIQYHAANPYNNRRNAWLITAQKL